MTVSVSVSFVPADVVALSFRKRRPERSLFADVRRSGTSTGIRLLQRFGVETHTVSKPRPKIVTAEFDAIMTVHDATTDKKFQTLWNLSDTRTGAPDVR